MSDSDYDYDYSIRMAEIRAITAIRELQDLAVNRPGGGESVPRTVNLAFTASMAAVSRMADVSCQTDYVQTSLEF